MSANASDRDGGGDDGAGTNEPPSLDALARQFLDLWQEQAALMAEDPATTEAMAQMLAVWQPFLGGAPTAATAGADEHDQRADGRRGSDDDPGPGASDGAAAAAGPSDGRDRLLLDLDRRLRALEERLDSLAPEAGAPGGEGATGARGSRGRGKKSGAKKSGPKQSGAKRSATKRSGAKRAGAKRAGAKRADAKRAGTKRPDGRRGGT